MEESSVDPTIDWRSPQRAGMAYFRVILESFHYLMRRKGIAPEKAKQVWFIYLAFQNESILINNMPDDICYEASIHIYGKQ